jgi:hypothetical protein
MKKNKIIFFNIFLIFVSLLLILVLVLFLNSNGFVAANVYPFDENDIVYSDDVSSSVNDNGVIGFFIVVRFFLVILSLFLISSKFTFFFYIFVWFFELFCLILISGTSDVSKTISYNKIFLIWFLIWFFSIPFSIFLNLRYCPSTPSH